MRLLKSKSLEISGWVPSSPHQKRHLRRVILATAPATLNTLCIVWLVTTRPNEVSLNPCDKIIIQNCQNTSILVLCISFIFLSLNFFNVLSYPKKACTYRERSSCCFFQLDNTFAKYNYPSNLAIFASNYYWPHLSSTQKTVFELYKFRSLFVSCWAETTLFLFKILYYIISFGVIFSCGL